MLGADYMMIISSLHSIKILQGEEIEDKNQIRLNEM